VLLLKGPRTVVAAPDGRAAVSTIANAALATAGSGDVLAGLIGALLAQNAQPFDAACLGVYLHARAGERLSMRLGNAGVLASDIAHEIPTTRHELDAHAG
jgi:NAD(P)H-hydrate epimerase